MSLKNLINYHVVTNSQLIYVKAKSSISLRVQLYLVTSHRKTLAQPLLIEHGQGYKCVVCNERVGMVHALSNWGFTR